jgi:hypothetical protein
MVKILSGTPEDRLRQSAAWAHDDNRPLLASACLDGAGEIARMRTALTEISKGEGAFSRDQLTHATNCIESMKQLALDALANGDEKPPREEWSSVMDAAATPFADNH